MSKSKKQDDAAQPMFEIPGVDQNSAAQEPPAQPQAIKTTDPMLAEVDANDIVGNSECIFTNGCRGRIYTYNTVKVRIVEDGKEIVETRQQLRCNSCGKIAKGYRVVGIPGHRRLYDRRQTR